MCAYLRSMRASFKLGHHLLSFPVCSSWLYCSYCLPMAPNIAEIPPFA